MRVLYDIKKLDVTSASSRSEEKFSILIPTWNNLGFVKLCIQSIRKYSRFQHQIILHVNDGSDGTLEWLQQQNIDYTHTPSNIGICSAVNLARMLARTNYIVYMNDDMVVCPEWDLALRRLSTNQPLLNPAHGPLIFSCLHYYHMRYRWCSRRGVDGRKRGISANAA